ncbi:MAG: TetR/AcrR family transcriptional regulator [Clostridiales bacterium]|nr:TetR/AcrR family transcriptional regulator [Clostridiales bacterium]
MPTSTFFNLPEEKRNRIFSAAVNEFAQRNIEAASFSNIVAEAGISRGSIYQYFRDKEDMYIYVFETLRAARAEYVAPAYRLYKKEPFLTFFEEFYMRDSEFLLNHPLHIEMGKHLYGHGHGVSRKLIAQIQDRYKERFIIGIDYDIERGNIRKDVNCAILADLCVHLVTDVFIFQMLRSSLTVANIRQQARGMLHILKNGVLPAGAG